MTTEHLRYLAYMLRVWQVREDKERPWRASLEDAHTGERRGFANLDDLFEFLANETYAPRQPSERTKDKQVPDASEQVGGRCGSC